MCNVQCAVCAVKNYSPKKWETRKRQSYCIVLYCILLATKSTASTFSQMMNVAVNIIGRSNCLFIIFNVNTFSVWLKHNLCIFIFKTRSIYRRAHCLRSSGNTLFVHKNFISSFLGDQYSGMDYYKNENKIYDVFFSIWLITPSNTHTHIHKCP